ncbi:MAG: hypothetical protein EAZ21_10555 [Betaproteobacteria bacterium]|nr:MAG: hypothetical protein EAZ21_10555 [Betaproteobacteria bacterium]
MAASNGMWFAGRGFAPYSQHLFEDVSRVSRRLSRRWKRSGFCIPWIAAPMLGAQKYRLAAGGRTQAPIYFFAST